MGINLTLAIVHIGWNYRQNAVIVARIGASSHFALLESDQAGDPPYNQNSEILINIIQISERRI